MRDYDMIVVASERKLQDERRWAAISELARSFKYKLTDIIDDENSSAIAVEAAAFLLPYITDAVEKAEREATKVLLLSNDSKSANSVAIKTADPQETRSEKTAFWFNVFMSILWGILMLASFLVGMEVGLRRAQITYVTPTPVQLSH